jgi:predicted metal-dependent hydrolase
LAELFHMPKSIRQKEEEEVAGYTARWLELADAAISATEKAAKALELARHEQERIRNDIQRRLKNYAKAGGRRVKRVG